MPRFAANLPMMYQEHTFLDRFAVAAKDGLEGMEFPFPRDFDKANIRVRLDDTGPTQVLLNAPPSGWAGGERGIASLLGHEEEFKCGIATAFKYAQVLGNMCLHVMADLLPTGADCARHHTIYVSNVAYAVRKAAGTGVTTVLEPINMRDMSDFSLTHRVRAHAVCKEVGAANVKVQFDLYHVQIMEDDLSVKLKQYVDGVSHVQITGVPDRHESDESELHHPHLSALPDTLGHNDWAGYEYRPRAGTSERLG